MNPLLDPRNLKYIVFVLDSKFEQHDGKVFSSLPDAREFVSDCINEKWGNKMIIGTFVLQDAREMEIEFIETFGLNTSKKKIEQLNLFH
jgi:hypothetical protein